MRDVLFPWIGMQLTLGLFAGHPIVAERHGEVRLGWDTSLGVSQCFPSTPITFLLPPLQVPSSPRLSPFQGSGGCQHDSSMTPP